MNRKNVLFLIVILLLIINISCTKDNNQKANSMVIIYNPESDFISEPINGGKGVKITEYIGEKWEVNIPIYIQGLPVIHIGDNSFKNKNIINVILPNNVTIIGRNAFEGNQLTNIIFPDSVTDIMQYSFADNHINKINIPNNIKLIGTQAFARNQIEELIIPDSFSTILNNKYINFVATTLEELTEMNNYYESISKISWVAFSGNPLKKINITEGANIQGIIGDSSIAKYYFENCLWSSFVSFYFNKNNWKSGTYFLNEDGLWDYL